MSKKTKLFLFIGMLFLCFSYYSSAAYVKPEMEREINITMTYEEEPPEETEKSLFIRPINDEFLFERKGKTWHVFTIENHQKIAQKINMEITLKPLVNGNHWSFELYTQPKKIGDQFDHQMSQWNQTFTLPANESIEVFVRSLEKTNNAEKKVPVDVSYEINTEKETFKVDQIYHINY